MCMLSKMLSSVVHTTISFGRRCSLKLTTGDSPESRFVPRAPQQFPARHKCHLSVLFIERNLLCHINSNFSICNANKQKKFKPWLVTSWLVFSRRPATSLRYNFSSRIFYSCELLVIWWQDKVFQNQPINFIVNSLGTFSRNLKLNGNGDTR